MWGNARGWGISVVIAITMIGLAALLGHDSSITPTTAFAQDKSNFEPLKIPVPSGAAALPSQACDARGLYRQAIDAYLSNRPLYDDFAAVGTLKSSRIQEMTAIDLLIEGSKCGQMTLFTARPQELITYSREKTSLDALDALGRVCVDRLALLNQRAEKPAAAMEYCNAALALGLHLANERLTYGELDLGMRLIAKTTPLMIKLAEQAGETDRAAALKEFDAQRISMFRENVEQTVAFVRSIDARIVGPRSGDMFALVDRSKERMWKVEAILALGRMRFFAGEGGTAGNQRAAMQKLRHIAETETDPIVKTAAIAARDLTVEQHRAQ